MFFMTAGQMSDCIEAAADWMIADQGHHADWFRDTLKDRGCAPLSPVGNRAAKLSALTSDAIAAVTALRTCSAC
jgi:hypothetical protein